MRKTHALKACVALFALQTIAGCGKAGDAPAPPAAAQVEVTSTASSANPASSPAPVASAPPAAPASTPRFVEQPEFTVVVQLTDQAAAAWKAANQPLVLAAEFVDEYGPGMTALAPVQKHSVAEAGPVKFSGTRIPLDKLQALRDPNYEVYVGVERGSQPTALDCGYVQQLVQNLQHKTFTLTCKRQGEA